MKQRGHEVSVFCATRFSSEVKTEEGITVYRCFSENPEKFSKDVLPFFSQVHQQRPFHLMESPEIHAQGMVIKQHFPELPMTVRLHMASFIQQQLLRAYISPWAKLRFFLGSLRKGKWKFLGDYQYKKDPEYHFIRLADGITSPSIDQRELVSNAWKLPASKIEVIPNFFEPGNEYLSIPVQKKTGKQVCFIGKLNTHKGVVSLVKALPFVLKEHPDAHFLLIGNDSWFFAKRMMMSDYIRKSLHKYMGRVTMMNAVPHADVPKYLASTAICVFPSLWEAFGLVCLEAMSAGRMVIGSKRGGMAEILDDNAGVLIDPSDYRDMAKQVCEGLSNEELRFGYGQRGRDKALTHYRGDRIGVLFENYYNKILAIAG